MSESLLAEVEDLGIGAKRRRSTKKSNIGIEPVKVPKTAKLAVKETKLAGYLNDAKGKDGAVEETHTFTLDYTDQRGYHWSGNFKTHVLSIKERTIVGLTRARLSGGVHPDQLDVTTLSLLEMQAHLAVSLDEHPDWAEDLSSFNDVGVIASIYEEVASHEARFWGADTE